MHLTGPNSLGLSVSGFGVLGYSFTEGVSFSNFPGEEGHDSRPGVWASGSWAGTAFIHTFPDSILSFDIAAGRLHALHNSLLSRKTKNTWTYGTSAHLPSAYSTSLIIKENCHESFPPKSGSLHPPINIGARPGSRNTSYISFLEFVGQICPSCAVHGPEESPLRIAYFTSCNSGITLYPLWRDECKGVPYISSLSPSQGLPWTLP